MMNFLFICYHNNVKGPQNGREHEWYWFYITKLQKCEKVSHRLARESQKHAVLCNLKGIRQSLWISMVETSAADIPPPSSPTPHWQPEANLNAVPMQISVIVMRQICRGKGHFPPPMSP